MNDKFSQELGKVVGWPEGVSAYRFKVFGDGPNAHVLVTGEHPVGIRKDGRPQYALKKDKPKVYEGIVSITQYRELLASSTATPT